VILHTKHTGRRLNDVYVRAEVPLAYVVDTKLAFPRLSWGSFNVLFPVGFAAVMPRGGRGAITPHPFIIYMGNPHNHDSHGTIIHCLVTVNGGSE
jgi:hypothetical protein